MIRLSALVLLRLAERLPAKQLVLLIAGLLGIDLLFPELLPIELLLGVAALAVGAWQGRGVPRIPRARGR
ncbi:MAG: hypothetical protein U1F23_10125 [Lysobacterales bacterium]